MSISNSESSKLYCIDWLPKNWRTLQKVWNSKENYKEQLVLNIEELVNTWIDLFKKNWEVRLLDIWWNNSNAIKELKEMLVKAWIPESKVILSKIDISDINNDWVEFVKWDLEDENFLGEVIKKLWKNSQWIIFMNQVSQYLWDRLWIIKFIAENLLIDWWNFNFNLITKSFDSWEAHISTLFDRLNEIIEEESEWYIVKIKNPIRIPDCVCYELIKKSKKSKLSMPKYRRTKNSRDVDWFKTVTYDFRLRTISYDVDFQVKQTSMEVENLS